MQSFSLIFTLLLSHAAMGIGVNKRKVNYLFFKGAQVDGSIFEGENFIF